jgi:hypothetical protein
MITTRVPSEAELIELENWFRGLQARFERAWVDWVNDDLDLEQWQVKYPELPPNESARDRLLDNFRALLDLARTVKNRE